MKIAVIADTHDNTPAVHWIINYLKTNRIKVAFHAGDLINPGIIRRFRDHYQGHLHFVFGNNDGATSSITQIAADSDNLTCHNREMNLKLSGKKIFMSHYSYIGEAIAKTGDYDLAIGGHDHRYRIKKYGKSLFINPGNTVTNDPWIKESDKNTQNTFIILDLSTMKPQKVIVNL